MAHFDSSNLAHLDIDILPHFDGIGLAAPAEVQHGDARRAAPFSFMYALSNTGSLSHLTQRSGADTDLPGWTHPSP